MYEISWGLGIAATACATWVVVFIISHSRVWAQQIVRSNLRLFMAGFIRVTFEWLPLRNLSRHSELTQPQTGHDSLSSGQKVKGLQLIAPVRWIFTNLHSQVQSDWRKRGREKGTRESTDALLYNKILILPPGLLRKMFDQPFERGTLFCHHIAVRSQRPQQICQTIITGKDLVLDKELSTGHSWSETEGYFLIALLVCFFGHGFFFHHPRPQISLQDLGGLH